MWNFTVRLYISDEDSNSNIRNIEVDTWLNLSNLTTEIINKIKWLWTKKTKNTK